LSDFNLQQQTARERLAGLLLIVAAGGALALANSPFSHAYHDFLHMPLGITLPRVGALDVHTFVVDGLMAIFFLLVGMEVKREWFEGRLATRSARQLPILAAIAGMAVPALIFIVVAWSRPEIHHGWAIPTATDIAFAIAVLAILGTHAPPPIKLLLIAIAIVDDVGAVAIIALFYTENLNTISLGIALGVTAAMATGNMLGMRRASFYMLGFAILWFFVLKSGIHATIAGVLAAMTIPLGPGETKSTLENLEHDIHPLVMFFIVPLFGFVSAGVAIPTNLAALAAPLPLAVALGLCVGKQLGVFGAIRLGSKVGLCCKPEGASWPQIYGASILCGIGFTMSLFITGLAFEGDEAAIEAAKIGTLAGSLVSALAGWLVLRVASPVPFLFDDVDEAERIFGQKRRMKPGVPDLSADDFGGA